MPTLKIHNNTGVPLDISTGRATKGKFEGTPTVTRVMAGKHHAYAAENPEFLVRAESAFKFPGSDKAAANYAPKGGLTKDTDIYVTAGDKNLEISSVKPGS